MATFQSTVPYSYQYQPTADASARLYLESQLRQIARSTLSHSNAISELQRGVSSGSAVTLNGTGVKPGTYALATVNVGADGRIYAISAGSTKNFVPETSIAGQILVSTAAGGSRWVSPAQAGGSSSSGAGGVPAQGTPGQVLTKSDYGSIWADPPKTGVSYVGVQSTHDLTVTGSPITSAGTVTLDLAPTGVVAGTYSIPKITVDAKGRILAVASSQINTQDTPLPYLTMIDQADGITEWRVSVVNGAWVFQGADQITAEDGSGPIMTEDGSGGIGAE